MNTQLQKQISSLTGLVKSKKNILQVRNDIYYAVFTPQWIQKNIPKDWLRFSLITLGIFFFLFSFVLFNDLFLIPDKSIKYTNIVYSSPIASKKLEYLAKLFDLHGIFTPDYNMDARSTFYNLKWEDQISLFIDPNISLEQKQIYLPTIIKGIYITLANVDSSQESSELLSHMRDSLKNVKTEESTNLQTEIDFWLQARNAITNEEALSQYNEAIRLNSNNPSTSYERSLVYIKFNRYEQALLDLDKTIALAQNIFTEHSEERASIPTSLLTETLAQSNNTITQEVMHQNALILVPNLIMYRTLPNNYPETLQYLQFYKIRESYNSNFYTFQSIRRAVELVLLDLSGKQQFYSFYQNDTNTYTNLEAAGLMTFPLPRAGVLQNLISATIKDQLITTLGAKITVVDVKFGPVGAQEFTNLYIEMNCISDNNGICPSNQVIVAVIDSFKEKKKKALENIPFTTQVLTITIYDPGHPTQVVEADWADVLAYINDDIPADIFSKLLRYTQY